MNLTPFKKKAKIVLIGFALVLGTCFSFSFSDDYFEVSKNLDIFATLFRELNIYYVDDIKPGDLMKKGIDAMLKTLDPYTNFIPESDIEDYRFMTTGQYGGVGALIRKKDDYVVISEPYEGFPAYKAGLKAGDMILEIDGKSAKGKNTNQISEVLKGQPNTKVKVLIKRGDLPPFEKEITREEIKINSVPYYGMLNDSVGYISFSSFTMNCSEDIKKAFLDLKATHNLKGLVFDLRGNPGGLLDEAIKVSNLFVDKGQDIVITKGRIKDFGKTYKSQNTPIDMKIPVVVLVNSGSASASEIVSGSLQDLDRAVILGQRTFGKGLVQTTRPISYNCQVKLTTAKYYIPSGRCIQALDYSHRNKDGSVGKVPDSLISEFKTKNGRFVYDGGGVLPDVETTPKEFPDIARGLMMKDIIFDYATKFARSHDSIPSPEKFKITDKIYEDFVAYSKSVKFEYKSETEKLIDKIKESSKKEKYFDIIKDDLEKTNKGILTSKENDLYKFREEVSIILKTEIVSRYYYQKGKIKASLSEDVDIAKALEVLGSKDKYRAIIDNVSKYNAEKKRVPKKNTDKAQSNPKADDTEDEE